MRMCNVMQRIIQYGAWSCAPIHATQHHMVHMMHQCILQVCAEGTTRIRCQCCENDPAEHQPDLTGLTFTGRPRAQHVPQRHEPLSQRDRL